MGNYMLDNVELAGCSVVLGENIQRLEDDPCDCENCRVALQHQLWCIDRHVGHDEARERHPHRLQADAHP